MSGEEIEAEGEKKPCLTLRKLLTKSQQMNGVSLADRKVLIIVAQLYSITNAIELVVR